MEDLRNKGRLLLSCACTDYLIWDENESNKSKLPLIIASVKYPTCTPVSNFQSGQAKQKPVILQLGE